MGFPGDLVVTNLLTNRGIAGSTLAQEDPLEREMTTHSSILAWEIPWTEEPGGPGGFIGFKRVRQDWATEHTLNLCVYIIFIYFSYIRFPPFHFVCKYLTLSLLEVTQIKLTGLT